MRFSQSTHLLMFLSLGTLMFIIRTDLPILVELIDLVNSAITFLSHLFYLINFPTQIPDCDSHSPALLDLFLSFEERNACICYKVTFPLLGNSDYVVVSVCIDFPSHSLGDAPFHCIAYDYSCADWDDLRDHLRDIPSEDIFKPSASAAASEFCEWV